MAETSTKERTRVKAGRQVVAAAGVPATLQPAPGSMLAVIARAAADPSVNVDKMQALLKMQQEIEDRDARKAFTVAFAALQKKLPSIKRDGRIEIREKDQRTGSRENGRVQQSTPYATFNGIMKAIKKPLDDCGFALSFATAPSADGRIIVRGILAHEEGFERTTDFPLPADTSGSKNNVQGWGSALAYGKRYCTIALCNLVSHAPEDADTDGHQGDFKPAAGGGLVEAESVAVISEKQEKELRTKMSACGVTESMICQKYGLDRLINLPADLVQAVIKQCEEYRDARSSRHG